MGSLVVDPQGRAVPNAGPSSPMDGAGRLYMETIQGQVEHPVTERARAWTE